MLAAGCGCPAVPFSNSSSTVTVLWALEGELTPQETTSGRSFTINFSLCHDIQYSIVHHIKPLCNLAGCGANEFFFANAGRRYIPILKDYPNRYIYEPWNAPESIQKAANCVVGVDYPKPMINHAEGSRLNIERMKQVYQQLSHYRGLSKSATKTDRYLPK